jgi:hypothetical protein
MIFDLIVAMCAVSAVKPQTIMQMNQPSTAIKPDHATRRQMVNILLCYALA